MSACSLQNNRVLSQKQILYEQILNKNEFWEAWNLLEINNSYLNIADKIKYTFKPNTGHKRWKLKKWPLTQVIMYKRHTKLLKYSAFYVLITIALTYIIGLSYIHYNWKYCN